MSFDRKGGLAALVLILISPIAALANDSRPVKTIEIFHLDPYSGEFEQKVDVLMAELGQAHAALRALAALN